MDFIRKLLERYLDSETSSVSGRETAHASILSEEHRKDIERKVLQFFIEKTVECWKMCYSNRVEQDRVTKHSIIKKPFTSILSLKECSFAVEAFTDVSENCLFVARCSVKGYSAFLWCSEVKVSGNSTISRIINGLHVTRANNYISIRNENPRNR